MRPQVPFSKAIDKILRAGSIDSLLEIAVDLLTSLLGAQRVTFYFYNEDTHELWSYAVTDLEIREIRLPLGEGIVGVSALRKKTLSIEDAYQCPYFNKKIDKATGYRTRSVLCVPLLDRTNKVLGVVQAINKKTGVFTPEDVENAKNIALYLAIALENIRLTQEQETLFRSTLYALASTIDAKDPVTAGHSYRVAYFAVKLARALGFPHDQLKILEYAAYLHDIGKIGIPESILCKKEKLTDNEYTAIKKHPLHTLRILKNIIFTKETKQIPFIASCHHEYLDGSGYPFGLRDKEISHLSRIISIIDFYDSMTAFDRPYRKHLAIKKTLKLLTEEARKNHLDKKLVAFFIQKKIYRYEQRLYRRLDLHITITYHILPQKKIVDRTPDESLETASADLNIPSRESTKSVNISSGGILFATKIYLPVGMFLSLDIKIFSKELKCLGKVVWIEKVLSTDNYRIGVKFVNLTPRARMWLAQLLAKRRTAKTGPDTKNAKGT
ncbi:MAG: HD domain-containing phosphohydrolase [Candidatus Omnitrophota bacterium]